MVKAKTATLQLVCMLVGDAVPHRCQWPPSVHLTVNGQRMHVKTAKRIGTQQLKPTQVDSLVDISGCVGGAASIVLLSGAVSASSSSSSYVLGARLVRQQGSDRVKALMAAPPSLEAALTAVKDKLAGDGDIEVSGAALPLRCPLSGCLIHTPARFRSSPGLDCFDLEAFLQVAAASGKWQCPQTMALHSVGELSVEPYLAAVLKALRGAGLAEGVEAVEVAPDGSWRPKAAAGGTAAFGSGMEDEEAVLQLGDFVEADGSGEQGVDGHGWGMMFSSGSIQQQQQQQRRRLVPRGRQQDRSRQQQQQQQSEGGSLADFAAAWCAHEEAVDAEQDAAQQRQQQQQGSWARPSTATQPAAPAAAAGQQQPEVIELLSDSEDD
ncbi:hypothetical protein OEZ86_012943 [Tetradesmus obliquus]|nr:hypothetical protein OEZ86_012943 [Tetradesmus obliquus]